MEEAERLSSIMTTSTNQPKAAIGGSSKNQGTSKPFKQVAMIAEVEVTSNLHMRCSKCGGMGHAKRNCPTDISSEDKSGGQTSTNNSKKGAAQKSQ